MRKLLIWLLVAGSLLAGASGNATSSLAASGPAAGSPERRMFELLNAERVAQGLTPVAWSSELGQAAELHSADMAARGYLDHDAPDGSTPQSRAARAGYVVPPGSGWMVIEAISARPSVEAAINWLLTDGVHRRVLLRSVWREVGIGHASGGAYGNYWVLDFGCRPNVLPAFSDPTADGGVVQLTFTNESCAASGGTMQQMGQATELMISPRADFKDGVWEPFVTRKKLPRPVSGELSIRLRDASGRLSAASRIALDAPLYSGSSSSEANSAASPALTSTAEPTREPTATATPEPTTETPTPTPEATATSTPTPEPTATSTPTPTATREPEE